MVELITVDSSLSKEERYQTLLPQVSSLLQEESDLVANLANICAALKQAFGFFWIGFYLVKDDQLVLGPFQGPVACTRIAKGKGVCGRSFLQGETIVVADVKKFPGHIACNPAARSEIVVPVFNENKVTMVLDIDSDQTGAFDDVDARNLEIITQLIFPVDS